MVALQTLTFAPTIVVDTSAASNSLKSETVAEMRPYLSGDHRPVHSFQTKQELITWSGSPWMSDEESEQVRAYIRRGVFIDSSDEIVRACAEIVRRRLDLGRRKNTEDAWTCAVAVVLGVPVVTYDRTGFLNVPGLEVILLVAP